MMFGFRPFSKASFVTHCKLLNLKFKRAKSENEVRTEVSKEK